MNVDDLPSVNAGLNTVATMFLVGAWWAIKRAQNARLHRNLMLCALAASTLFLASYTYYHYNTGHTAYEGEGLMRVVYFAILITHVPLAALMVPFILAALWFAFRQRFDWHTRITRWLWPVWMYVSITGVLIYLMLYQL